VTVTAPSVAEAFEHLYLFERASKTLLLAYATGQALAVLPDIIAEKTAREWRPYDDMAFAHFAALKAMLDRKDPSYRD
jgi:ribulose-5-phosphate 4-epimerase/fuculose-1-phosphate aldolase